MMIVGLILAVVLVLTALYGFGVLRTPYTSTFRVAFYFLLIFFVVTIVVGAITQSYYGYDPTPQGR